MAYFCDKKIYFVLTTYSSGGDLFFYLRFVCLEGLHNIWVQFILTEKKKKLFKVNFLQETLLKPILCELHKKDILLHDKSFGCVSCPVQGG